MAIIPITLAEKLRPWRTAGLFHFLQDPTILEGLSAEDVQALLGQNTQEQEPLQATTGLAAGVGRQDDVSASQGQSIGAGQPFAKHGPAGGFVHNTQGSNSAVVTNATVMGIPANPSTQTPQTSVPVTSSLPRENAAAHHAVAAPMSKGQPTPIAENQTAIKQPEVPLQLDATQWPALWQQAFAKAKPAPILWSYATLGEDLGGKANPARGTCLRGIIGSLQLPKGTSSFWSPAVLNAQGQLEESSALFLSGVKLLNPKLVIAIGQDLLEFFAPKVSLTLPLM